MGRLKKGEESDLASQYVELRELKRTVVAGKLFNQCLAICPEDRPSQIYLQRAQQLKITPPPADWSGVWIMDAK